jgi:hypothetical protein
MPLVSVPSEELQILQADRFPSKDRFWGPALEKSGNLGEHAKAEELANGADFIDARKKTPPVWVKHGGVYL